MKLDIEKIFPADPLSFEGSQFIRIATALLILVMVVRSCIHLFASDGGAHRIGGVDISVEGGSNLVAMFHQWGAIQLVLAVLLSVLFFHYPGFTPLILLTIGLDLVLRYVAGRMQSMTTTKTPPGAAFNGLALLLVMLLFVVSIVS